MGCPGYCQEGHAVYKDSPPGYYALHLSGFSLLPHCQEHEACVE